MRLVIALAEAAAANASTTAAASGGGVAGDTCGDAAAAVSSLLSPALCCSAFAVSGDSTPAFRWFVGGDDNDILLLGEAGRKAMVDNCHTRLLARQLSSQVRSHRVRSCFRVVCVCAPSAWVGRFGGGDKRMKVGQR